MTKGEDTDIDGIKTSGIIETNLLENLPGREFRFKELNDLKPVSATDPEVINPAPSEIIECVFTTPTSKSFADDPLDFAAVTYTGERGVLFNHSFVKEERAILSVLIRLSNDFKPMTSF